MSSSAQQRSARILETNIAAERSDAVTQMLQKDDLGIIQTRIRETLRILANLKELRQGTKTRKEYLEELKNDVSSAYDYNRDLCELFFQLFPPAEALEFIEANE